MQWFPGRLAQPYIVFLVALVLAPVLAPAMPETRAAPPLPAQTCERAPHARGRLSAATVALVAFAAFGLFTSLAPSFLAGRLHRPSLILAGAAPFAVVVRLRTIRVGVAVPRPPTPGHGHNAVD